MQNLPNTAHFHFEKKRVNFGSGFKFAVTITTSSKISSVKFTKKVKRNKPNLSGEVATATKQRTVNRKFVHETDQSWA